MNWLNFRVKGLILLEFLPSVKRQQPVLYHPKQAVKRFADLHTTTWKIQYCLLHLPKYPRNPKKSSCLYKNPPHWFFPAFMFGFAQLATELFKNHLTPLTIFSSLTSRVRGLSLVTWSLLPESHNTIGVPWSLYIGERADSQYLQNWVTHTRTIPINKTTAIGTF